MDSKKPLSDKLNAIISEARKGQKDRQGTYREKALKMYPHICARCGTEYSGSDLSQLTVHHKDHNHDNNPPDGSNWELLCIYCHDNEHERDKVADAYREGRTKAERSEAMTTKAFAGLEDLLKKKE